MPENIQRCSFAVGDTIDDTYRVEKVLGEGTFGVVYSVSDFQGRKYALKLLRLWEVQKRGNQTRLIYFPVPYSVRQSILE